MEAAAREPSATASIRLRGPFATSPPAQMRGCDVARVPASTRTVPLGFSSTSTPASRSRSAAWPTARITESAGVISCGSRPERRGESTLRVEHRLDRDRLEPGHAGLADEPMRTASVDDRDSLPLGLGDLLGVGRDLVGRLEREHGHVANARPQRHARDVEGRRHRPAGVVLRRDIACRCRRWLRRARPLAARCAPRRTPRCRRRPRRPARRGRHETLVDVEQELDGAQDAVELMARQVEVARPPGPDREEQAGMVLEELGNARVGADPEAGPRLDSELEDRVDLTRDQRTCEPVLGYAEHHHPAETVVRLVHRDGMPRETQVVRSREPGGPSADHADRRAVGGRDRAVGLVPHRVRREALDAEALGHEALQRPDRDRRVDRAAPAGRLARRRAHASAHRGERVGRPGDQVRVAVATLGDRGDVRARVGVHRARGTARLVLPEPASVRDPGPGRGARHSDHTTGLEPPQPPRERGEDHEEADRRDRDPSVA